MEDWIRLIVGSGGLLAIVTAYFSRKTSKEEASIEWYDRAIAEIDRLDKKLVEAEEKLAVLRIKLAEEQTVSTNLQYTINDLEEVIKGLKYRIEHLRGGNDL